MSVTVHAGIRADVVTGRVEEGIPLWYLVLIEAERRV